MNYVIYVKSLYQNWDSGWLKGMWNNLLGGCWPGVFQYIIRIYEVGINEKGDFLDGVLVTVSNTTTCPIIGKITKLFIKI